MNKRTNNTHRVKATISVVFVTLLAISMLYPKTQAKAFIGHSVRPQPMPTADYKVRIEEEIRNMAAVYGVDVDTALRIAKCESSLNPQAKNKHSTAKGVYQFTDPTWKWIKAEGHQYDYKENIIQFMKYYPKYPQWWVCK